MRVARLMRCSAASQSCPSLWLRGDPSRLLRGWAPAGCWSWLARLQRLAWSKAREMCWWRWVAHACVVTAVSLDLQSSAAGSLAARSCHGQVAWLLHDWMPDYGDSKPAAGYPCAMARLATLVFSTVH